VGHTTDEMYEKLGFDREGTLDAFLLDPERRGTTPDPGSTRGSAPR
jgi:hypothetical protein